MTRPTSSEPLSYLVADDDPVSRRVLEAILTGEGGRVVTAVDGIDALQCYHKERPDVVFLDLHMPRLDGRGVARSIRSSADRLSVPIVFLTGDDAEETLERCIDAGADEFMNKPARPTLVRAKLKALLRNRALHQTLRRQRDELDALHEQLSAEHEAALQIFARLVASRTEALPEVRSRVSSMARFNGDVILSVRGPAGRIHVLLGDFTGHGLPAAIGAPPVCNAFYRMTRKGFFPREILREINDKLRELLPRDHFLAAAFAAIDPIEGTATVWNGGVPDVLVRGPHGGIRHRVPSRHLPLGVLDSARLDPEPETFALEPGDRIFLTSDGVVETRDPAGHLFGNERLEDVLGKADDPDGRLDALDRWLDAFRAGEKPSDDVSIAEIRYDGPVAAEATSADGGTVPDPGTGWRAMLELDADALRKTDPVPLVLQILGEIDGMDPHRAPIFTVLSELVTNALDHGILGLDSSWKQEPGGFTHYYAEREKGLAALERGFVRIELESRPDASGGRLRLSVADSGAGFELAPPSDEPGAGHSGRGLRLVREICESLEREPTGNGIRAVYAWDAPR